MGQMAPITRGLQGPGNAARGGQAPADTILSKSRAIHCPHGGGGLGAPLSALHLSVITTPWLATVQTTPRVGTRVPGRTELGLLLRSAPSHGWGLGEGVWGMDSDFQQPVGEAAKFKDRVPRNGASPKSLDWEGCWGFIHIFSRRTPSAPRPAEAFWI